ncbi:hypothetical protein GJ496_008145 [Pomphorhynchus laevis]|nr:hypothetical protein GJ496_008145 [Pomphorhynchus laevis]
MRYEVGQQLLCFHGPHLYDAKCIRYDQSRGYLVHYIGWNQSWDEWVPESRLLEDNECNRKIQIKLESQNQPELFKANAKLSPIAGKKRSRQSKGLSDNNSAIDNLQQTVETEEQYQNTVEIHVEIPIALRPWLLDDWDLIMEKEMLIVQPSTPTVQNIVDQFLVEYPKYTNYDSDVIPEFCRGIIEYFNNMLPNQLLYKVELRQARKLINIPSDGVHSDKALPPSDVYGGIHFLRMFVKVGRVLAQTWLNEEEVARLLDLFKAFLRFMENNHGFFNMQEYISAQKAESSMNISDTKSLLSTSNESSDYEESIRRRRPTKNAKGSKRTPRKKRAT